MKRVGISFLGVLGLLLTAASAFAQDIHVRANIPFNFIVNKDTLPAGQYEVKAEGSSGSHVLAISNWEERTARLFLTNNVDSLANSSKTKLVFERYGDRYFLSQIWVQGEGTGRELPKSAREREVAMDYVPAKVVVLAELR